jgi:hypothetical protein
MGKTAVDASRWRLHARLRAGARQFKDGYLHKATVEFFRQHRDDLATLSDECPGELEGITTKPSTSDIIKE